MKLSPQMHFNLARLNTALVRGDEGALVECLEGIDLPQLLSQETIQRVRSRGKNPLCIFLCTLAVANEVEPARAQVWLDCYQSIVTGSLREGVLRLSTNNILRVVIESIIADAVLAPAQARAAKGSPQNWIDAFELALDSRQWESAVNIQEAICRKPGDKPSVLQVARSLSQRNDLYVDLSGLPQPDVDYLRLAQLYESCIHAAGKARAGDIVGSLKRLRAGALETAGRYDEAVKLLQPLAKDDKGMRIKLTIARNLCKSGDLGGAIDRLDEALHAYRPPAAELKEDAEGTEAVLQPEPPEANAFDVGKASRALSDLARIFNESNLKMFLVSGTLLGYEREGRLLDHDKDIDVGVVGWESQYDICLALQKSGLFTISTQYLKGKGSFYIPVVHHVTGIWIDVFIYYPQDGKLVTGVDFFFGHRQTFAFTPFELKPVNFLGVDMYVPEDTDLNLRENFGDWRVPDASYLSHLESPSTMNKGGLEYMITARMQTLAALVKKKPKKLRKVIEVMQEHLDRPGVMAPGLQALILSHAERLERMQARRAQAAATDFDLPELEHA